jgi:hypothetical protein
MGQPTWWRRMAQPSLVAQSSKDIPADHRPLAFLPAGLAGRTECEAFVVVVRDAESFARWSTENDAALQWIEVHDLLDDLDPWRAAAQIESGIPIDVVMGDPAREYARLYHLVDVRNVRPVRVTIPVRPGFLKALRLAASLQLPVRLLPGQPPAEVRDELLEAVEFYLRDPMVEAPVDYFHSALASMQTGEPGSLCAALEEDPALYLRLDEAEDPARSTPDHAASPTVTDECRECPWLGFCGGYFKQPDPEYACDGVIRVFEVLRKASEELTADLSALEQDHAS